jgi:N-acyl-D-amino-acid deacylase
MLDLLIADALVVDGSGSPPTRGSVGVESDRVAWVAAGNVDAPAARVVRAAGRALTPGFIDVHNHSDLSPLIDPEMQSTLRQGTTTVVVGNCGSSPWPLSAWEECVRLAYADPIDHPVRAWRSWSEYLDAIDEARPSVNLATLIGHGSIRREVMGLERRAPLERELREMCDMAAEATRQGAFGLSTGLIYVPGMFSRTDEVVALARSVAAVGGIYASHIRGEGRDLFSAIDEAIEIGARAELPAHVSHLKCESSLAWGRTEELLSRFHGADDVSADQYPYAAWNSSLASLLPPWAPVEHIAAIAARDAGRLRAAVEEGEPDFQSSVNGVGWDRVVISQASDARWNGLDLATIGDQRGMSAFDALIALLTEDPDTACIGHAMRDDDVLAILRDPNVFVASDASAVRPDGPAGALPVHPREYGTFPRALALARDDGMPLETIVRKMTSLPAERFGLADRGRIAAGSFADLVLLDPDGVHDTSTYERPHAFPDGIELVVTNGQVAWDAAHPGEVECAGRALRRT